MIEEYKSEKHLARYNLIYGGRGAEKFKGCLFVYSDEFEEYFNSNEFAVPLEEYLKKLAEWQENYRNAKQRFQTQ